MDGINELMMKAKEASELIAKHVKSGSNILVVGHNDADGLASLGIAGGTLRELDANLTIRCIRRIDDLLSDYIDGDYDLLIMVDMGSGYLPELSNVVNRSSLLILDHHKPAEHEVRSNWFHLNPHSFGMDGAREVSASGVTYLVFRNLIEPSYRYAPVAIVGALGDLQDKNGRRLSGVNRTILEEGVRGGLIMVEESMIIHGRALRPVHQALASTYNPFLPGLSGNEAACLAVVTSAGIDLRSGDSWRTFKDLSEDEVKALHNAIIAYMVKNGYPSGIVSELYGEVYELTGEEEWTSLRDGREFATLLNACGKGDRPWLGIVIAMGERGKFVEEAHEALERYRSSLAKVMELISRPGMVEQMVNIIVVRGGSEIDPKQVSSIATLLSSSRMLPPEKPLVAFAYDGNVAKISARCNDALAEAGLDLGSVMSAAARKFGGQGGGHKMAAGAEVQADRLTLFLIEVDRLVGEWAEKRKKSVQTSLKGL